MRQIPRLLLLCLLSAPGCTLVKKAPPTPPAPPSPVDLYAKADGQTLLEFMAVLVRSTPTQRQEECDRLLGMQKSKPSIGVDLHLMLAQVLLKDCGDISKNLGSIQLRRAEITDENARGLFGYTEHILGRLDHEMDKRKNLERQLRVTSQRVQSTSRQMKTRESEIKSLQDKIDALKSIEQNLGGSEDGN